MTAPNGDLLYTKDWKTDKKNTLSNRKEVEEEKRSKIILIYF